MTTYRVYFRDGNQRLYEAITIVTLCNSIELQNAVGDRYGIRDIVKIEEVN